MKVQVKTGSGYVVAEGNDLPELWAELASLQEAFGEAKCGKCGKDAIRYVAREDAEGNKYYELHCQSKGCYAKLRMSQRKKTGNLYPRRKAGSNDKSGREEGAWLPDNGWMKYDKETGKES